ncbi:MAG TPA: adenylate/guanylate cyclase domain-containing protein, partial [Mycobacterium sp.]|nr:adenylate/guanylate cyclase domain-containing protein [Mycobacterium sp.]
ALMADGFAWRNTDPDRALEATRRGLRVAHESGNRFNETHIAANLAQLEVEHGDPLSALDHIGLAIRQLHDSGNIVTLRSPFANLAILFDRLARHEPAATIAGFGFSPLTAASFPNINVAIAHLREVLGDQTYESLARKGETMTTAAMATYAYDQIDQARTELNAVSN